MTSVDNIQSIVSNMSLQEQVLELLMLDVRYFTSEEGKVYPLTSLPPEIEAILNEYSVGGTILFRENIAQLADVVKLTDGLQKNVKFGRLIAIDQEGGSVTRIHSATEMPGNMALGAINNVLVTSQASQILATELDALGFNFMFSPVLDVNSNPQNPIVGVRSFGKDPELVARHGVAYCDGLNRENMIACGKHFPGHGDTDVDSHHDLPLIRKSLSEFEQVDLVPFKVAVAANIDSLMTAHIVFPDLDSGEILSNKTNKMIQTPATLSKKIMTDLLRNQMQYQGIIVSDALDMKAISDNFTPVEATVNCIAAGVDLILMPIRLWSKENILDFRQYMIDLVAACQNSELLKQSVFESCCRIIELKLRKVLPKLMAQASFDERLKRVHELVYCEKHQQLQQEIAAKAVALAKNENNILPWASKLDEAILLIAANDAVAHDASNALKRLYYSNVVVKSIEQEFKLEELKQFSKVIVLSYNLNPTTALPFNSVINLLQQGDISHIVLSCHNPYDNLYLENVNTLVLAFGCSGLDQTNYSIRKFELNMSQAIRKIMTAKSLSEFNMHLPV
jgi:beta-N-acetylhexosaminidase